MREGRTASPEAAGGAPGLAALLGLPFSALQYALLPTLSRAGDYSRADPAENIVASNFFPVRRHTVRSCIEPSRASVST
jgi:hypothetical protein